MRRNPAFLAIALLGSFTLCSEEKSVLVGPSKDTPETIEWEAADLKETKLAELMVAAKNGDARAQLLLGKVYALGAVVRQDDTKSAEWYRKSADRGNAIAQLLLCNSYQHGYGVLEDKREAAEWCLKAAEQGLVEAQSKLASLLRQREEYQEAARWAGKAAEQGLFSAQFNLANMYEIGQGVQTDKVTAYMWLLVAKESLCGPPQRLCIEAQKTEPTQVEVYLCGPPPVPCVERYPEFKAALEKFSARIAAELSIDQATEATRRAREWKEKLRATPKQ